MINDYNKIMPGLEKEIVSKIHKLEKRNLLYKQGTYGLISLLSFIGIIYSITYLNTNLSNSGAFSYISLIFSDITALSYWKELSLSILESLPFLGIAIGFAVLGVFLWSMLKTIRIQSVKGLIA